MNVLIVKMSSMGDLIHSLPALSDAATAIPGIQFDWVAEQAFSEIPRWHPSVKQVIPIQLRNWRKHPFKAWRRRQWQCFFAKLRETHYDVVIDAQGLLKSAVVSCSAKGKSIGLDWASARESLASCFYQKKVTVNYQQHAIDRTRQLFAKALGYQFSQAQLDYQINRDRLPDFPLSINSDYVVFLHGTTWASKHWPLTHWQQLIDQTAAAGLKILLPWGNQQEHHSAAQLADYNHAVTVLPKCGLGQLATLLTQAKAVVAVDSGLGHLAAALSVPCISLYGPTDPAHIGTRGAKQIHLSVNFKCAPCRQKICHYKNDSVVSPACFSTVTAQQVWAQLALLLNQSRV